MDSKATQRYSPGQWVVTAGGTEDKAEKLVEITGEDGDSYAHSTIGLNWRKSDMKPYFTDFETALDYGPILRLATDEEVAAGKVLPQLTFGGRVGGCTLIEDPRPPIRTAVEWGRVVVEGRKLNKHDRARLYVMVGKREEELVGLRADLEQLKEENRAAMVREDYCRQEIEHLARRADSLTDVLRETQSALDGGEAWTISATGHSIINDVKAMRVERNTLRSTLNSRIPWWYWLLTGAAVASALIALARALGWV